MMRVKTIAIAACAACAGVSGCSDDPAAPAVAGSHLNAVLELRGHPPGKNAWRAHVRAPRGSVVTYRITVFNPGSRQMGDVRLQVELPPGLRLIGGKGSLPPQAFDHRGMRLASLAPRHGRDYRYRARYTRRASNPAKTIVTLTSALGRRSAVIPTTP